MGQTKPSGVHREPANFLIGKDRHGHWVVQDQAGLRGGMFASEAQALKYALLENGNRPDSVSMAADVLELGVAISRNHAA